MNDKCPQGVKNEQRINALEDITQSLKADIKDIKDRLLGRPTWVITVLFTFLTSACVGLLLTVLRIK